MNGRIFAMIDKFLPFKIGDMRFLTNREEKGEAKSSIFGCISARMHPHLRPLSVDIFTSFLNTECKRHDQGKRSRVCV